MPYLGICLGMQIAAIEFARNVDWKSDSTEFNAETPDPVIYLMPGQRNIYKKGGTMRLGDYECDLRKDSKSFLAYEEEKLQNAIATDTNLTMIIRKDLKTQGWLSREPIRTADFAKY